MSARPRTPLARLNPKRLLVAFAAVATAGLSLFTWHHFADEPTKGKIERGTLAVVDIVRENRGTPEELVFWLDLVADAMPVARGRGVPAQAPESGAETTDKFSPWGEPECARKLTRLTNIGFAVGYDERSKNPAWVAYKVTEPRHKLTPRPAGFETDLRTTARVRNSAYSHSGYDRGHMAPNAAIAMCAGEAAQKETFRLSNITPQLHGLNDGLWRAMEQRILHRYPRRFKEVWVTCGPVFDNTGAPRLLREGVRVPDAFYLIVADRDEATGELRAQGYLMPHREIPEDEDPSIFLTDIRTIETRTGLNFFPLLPSAGQDALELPKPIKAW